MFGGRGRIERDGDMGCIDGEGEVGSYMVACMRME